MGVDFQSAQNTIILSDIHIADAEPPQAGNPLWKRFKRKKFFIDRSFKRMLEDIQSEVNGTIELVLNGDIFDFDSVMQIPKNPPFHVSFLEKKRGLSSEEDKSLYKMDVILKDHDIFVDALRSFILHGNRVIFVIGNHDMELHWPAVRETIVRHLKLPNDLKSHVRFCDWFYISNQDTLIEHGNQYDPYCLCQNPVNPLIKVRNKTIVRLPFGNLAGKYLTNGMGLFNPHVESSFIKSSVKEYAVFFYSYVFRVQPFIYWAWLWGALTTLWVSLREGFLPPLRDPLMLEERVNKIAENANATPSQVRLLRELHVHPAVYSPLMIIRELWLDRFIFFLLICYVSFQIYSFINLFAPASIWVLIIPLLILMPIFVFYARSVISELHTLEKKMIKLVPLSAKITKVHRVIHGHTHKQNHFKISDVEYLNTGTWSPAFHDVECTQPYGKKCFAWIRAVEGSDVREASIYEWKDPGIEKIPMENNPFEKK